jgi:RNA polymerase sigma factor (sigma-70 family)
LTDGQLLERFVTAPPEAAEMAFAALVERHGPMVYRTCRGVLGDEHAAHDAFQATFLVLVKKRRTLWVRDSLGPWLHRVAGRAAARARLAAARQQAVEQGAAVRPVHTSLCAEAEVAIEELSAIVHEEVDRLPARYRVPIVLCDLEGHSQEDAARHLGCAEGTIKSRLSRGRAQLRTRLTRRGVAPTAALPLPGTAGARPSAVLPDTLVERTIQTATRLTTNAAGGAVAPSVAAITEGVLQTMFPAKLKMISAALCAALGLAIGVASLAQPAANQKAPAPVALQQPGAAPVDRSRWTRSFPSGTTVELVGLSTYPSGPNTWWSPDGRPLAEAPGDPFEKNITAQDAVYRVIAVRTTGEPADTDVGWSISPSRGSSSRFKLRRLGLPTEDLAAMVFALPRERATCDVKFSLAAGPWTTAKTAAGSGSESSGANGRSFIFTEPLETKNGLVRVVTHNIQDLAVRLVAVDHAGKEHLPTRSGGGGAGGFSQIVGKFDLRNDQVEEFRLQTRSFEEVTIKDVALNPVRAGE